ncbi:phosphotransferase family protein [Natronospora cellulosivora (SeqCode)]
MNASKWREPVVDPYSISFKNNLKLESIEGYPHAGNDVFKCRGTYKDKEVYFYLKIARHLDANLENELKALEIFSNLSIPVPEVIAYDLDIKYPYIATKLIDGERLSKILSKYKGDEIKKNSLIYMEQFGAVLAKIHSARLTWKEVKTRRFHKNIDTSMLTDKVSLDVSKWLEENKPSKKDKVFVHGDYHYANLLWSDNKIAAVLDWELCGIGWKEFDIAWAIILRPSQKFLKTELEEQRFLDGYSKHCSFDNVSFDWCKVLIYLHFYIIGKKLKDNDYIIYVIKKMLSVINKYKKS